MPFALPGNRQGDRGDTRGFDKPVVRKPSGVACSGATAKTTCRIRNAGSTFSNRNIPLTARETGPRPGTGAARHSGWLFDLAFPVFHVFARHRVVFPDFHLFGHRPGVFPGHIEMPRPGRGIQADLDGCGLGHGSVPEVVRMELRKSRITYQRNRVNIRTESPTGCVRRTPTAARRVPAGGPGGTATA